MQKDKEILITEIRYAQRLCARTARLYRHLQTAGVMLAVIGGSAAASSATSLLPEWLGIVGAIVLTIMGGASLAVRPSDKAAANENDAKKYGDLLVKAQTLTALELEKLLAALISDVPEVELLRQVAYNDVVTEIGQESYKFKLSFAHRLFAALA